MKISDIGIHDSFTNDRKNKIKLLNVFTIIAFGVFFASGITNLLINDIFSGVLLIGFSIFTLFTIIFNYIHLNKLAISYLFAIISFGIFYFDSYSGIESGSYLYYFPLFLGIANLFDFRTKRDKQIVFIQTSIIILLAIINVVTDYKLFKSDFLNKDQIEIMFKSNLILTLLSISYFIYIIIRSNIRKVELLEELIIEENKLNQLEREKTKEKEILLAEIQHRLKNNLSIISSLIKLKNENIKLEDFNFTQQEIWHAVHTIALAHHHQIYKSNGFYVPIKKFTDEIISSYHLNEKEIYKTPNVHFKYLSHSEIHIKQAVPFGLFIHECISKFYFNSRKSEEPTFLTITISEESSSLIILIESTNFVSFLNKSDRIDLTESFLEQLDGTIIKKNDNCFEYSFELKMNQPEIESRKIF